MGVKKIKCPVCGNFKTEWISEIRLKETHRNYLVWCCTVNNEEHWAKGSIFLSDIKLNPLSIEESDEIQSKVHREEFEEFDF